MDGPLRGPARYPLLAPLMSGTSFSEPTDRTIRVWDVDTGTRIVGPLEGATNWVCSVAYCPDE